MTSTQGVLLVTAIACGLGGVFLLIGYLRVRMTRGWTRTAGVVVDRRTGARSGGMPARYPTFQWQDQAGQVHQRTSSVYSSLGPSPGKQVPILFDPEKPSRAIIDSFVQSGRIFFLIGAIIVVLGIVASVMFALTSAMTI